MEWLRCDDCEGRFSSLWRIGDRQLCIADLNRRGWTLDLRPGRKKGKRPVPDGSIVFAKRT